MRLSTTLFPLLVAPLATQAFVSTPRATFSSRNGIANHKNFIPPLRLASEQTSLADEDCGCGPATTTTTFAGNPSESAKTMNSRTVMDKSPVYRLNGEKTTIGDILDESNRTSLVVFLRSLG